MKPVERVRGIRRGGLTIGRIYRAVLRRSTALPHNVAYSIRSGPSSANWKRIAAVKGRHSGERCFVLGNGPSLARMDLARIHGEQSFGTNRIFLGFEQSGFRPTYYVCMNDLVLKQSAPDIAMIAIPKFLNWRQRRLFEGDDNSLFLRESYRPHFSTDLTGGIWGGSTVTFAALQIAYYMGFHQVVLIGVDHSYSSVGTPHSTAVARGPDKDHFHSAYFTDGFMWHLPDLATSELAYRMARKAYEADNREVLDATSNGKLEVFRKVPFERITG